MKKFLAMLMLLAMCFSCAAMAETTDEDLAAAKTYLFMMYKDLPETTMSDYEVVGVINIGGIEFPITWTATPSRLFRRTTRWSPLMWMKRIPKK